MTYEVSVQEQAQQEAAVIRQRVQPESIPEFLQAAFAELFGTLQAQGVDPCGPPFARYAPQSDGFDVTAGVPVSSPVAASGAVVPDTLPGGLTATTVHSGPYEGLSEAFHAVIDWIAREGYAVAADPWESYLDGPDVPQPRTMVCFPVTRADT